MWTASMTVNNITWQSTSTLSKFTFSYSIKSK